MKSIFKLFIVQLLFLNSFTNGFAQNFELKIHAKDSANNSIINSINIKRIHKTKNDLFNEVDAVSNNLKLKGFIYNEFNVNQNDSIFSCEFTLYQKIEIIRIHFEKGQLPKTFLDTISLKHSETFFEIGITHTENALNSIVAYFENQGYSFTNVFLSDITQENTQLSARLNISVSKKRTIDQIVIKGYEEFPKKFLKHYLEITPSTTFNLEYLDRLNNLINSIPFVTQIKKPEVLFTKDSTSLYLYLKKNSNSSFDGIIGFSNEESGKLRFNGFLDLELHNILNKGESFNIHWENSQNKNSSLKLGFNSPYIFNSKINFKGNFTIFKQDSLFVNTNGLVELGYSINRNNSIQVIGTTEKSNLSNSNSEYNINDFNKVFAGVSYTYNIIQYPIKLNEYKFYINAGYFLGSRKTSDENTSQYGFDFNISYTTYFNTRNSIFIKTQTQFLESSNLFENELFRIGGINSIRGFNQNSILTSRYNVTNLEYHYNVNRASYLYSITDFALLNDINTNSTTQLYGLGIGYYLNTTNIILDLSYALGKNYNTPFNINNSKFHIKLTYPF